VTALANGGSPLPDASAVLYVPLCGVASPEPNLIQPTHPGIVTGTTPGPYTPMGSNSPCWTVNQDSASGQVVMGTIHYRRPSEFLV
jgi:hypothetical protein